MGFNIQRPHEERCKTPMESTSNPKGSTNTMNTKALPRVSAAHYIMFKEIMKRRKLRKEDECIEEMIQELYNSK